MNWKISRIKSFYDNGYDNTAIMLKGLIDGIIKRGNTENAKLIDIIKETIKDFNSTKRLIRKELSMNEEWKNEYILFTNKLILMLKKELKIYEKLEYKYGVKD